MIMVVRIEFKNIGWHTHSGKGHHHTSDIHKNAGKAILCFCKKALFGKEIDIYKTNSKADIDDQRRKNALLTNGAHAIKVMNGE
jgi:hypothetical protein